MRGLAHEKSVEWWEGGDFAAGNIARRYASRDEVDTMQLVRRFEDRCLATVVASAESDLQHSQQHERRKNRYHGEDKGLSPREFGAQGFIRGDRRFGELGVIVGPT